MNIDKMKEALASVTIEVVDSDHSERIGHTYTRKVEVCTDDYVFDVEAKLECRYEYDKESGQWFKVDYRIIYKTVTDIRDSFGKIHLTDETLQELSKSINIAE